jgi:hypothetical protein
MSLKIMLAALALATVAACTPDQLSSGNSIHKMPQGTVLSGRVQIGLAVFDLPEGEWTLVATNEQGTGSLSAGDAQAMLMRFNKGSGDKVLGLISVTASMQSTPVYWLRNRSCENKTSLHIVDAYQSEQMHDCWFVRAWRPNWKFENAQQVELDGVKYASKVVDLSPVTFLGTLHWVARRGVRISVYEYASASDLGTYSGSADDWIEVARAKNSAREKIFADWLARSSERHAMYIAGLTGALPPPSRPAGPKVAPDKVSLVVAR